MLTDSAWYLDSGKGDSAQNMALDEALLEAMPRLGKPVLRFYGWTGKRCFVWLLSRNTRKSSVSLFCGHWSAGPTGGGLVAHDADWTYSLLFRLAMSGMRLRPRKVTS